MLVAIEFEFYRGTRTVLSGQIVSLHEKFHFSTVDLCDIDLVGI